MRYDVFLRVDSATEAIRFYVDELGLFKDEAAQGSWHQRYLKEAFANVQWTSSECHDLRRRRSYKSQRKKYPNAGKMRLLKTMMKKSYFCTYGSNCSTGQSGSTWMNWDCSR